jgi:hypothetical protein
MALFVSLKTRQSVAAFVVSALLVVTCLEEVDAFTLAVDARGEGRPISPYIYGVSYPPSLAYIKAGGFGLIRWGSTGASTYNWKAHASNKGEDWFFSNGKGMKSHDPMTPCDFLQRGAEAGAAVLLTIPALGWVAKDTTSYSFSVAKYGPQEATRPDRPDAGNGLRPDRQPIRGNSPSDAMVPAFAARRGGEPPATVFADEWIKSLQQGCKGQVAFYAIDNEPEIWHIKHRNVHPRPAGYDEILHTFIEYAGMVKGEAPNTLVSGPVINGWYNYWSSEVPGDKTAHGGQDFLPWFLQQVRAYDQAKSGRSLDILDVHFYPSELFWSNRTDPATNALRLRATRSLWDPSYDDETALGRSRANHHQPDPTRLMLIPRLNGLLDQAYPGTRLGITEWNFGGGHQINGGLATAEVLGILGREGVFMASHWQGPRGYPDETWPSFQAFRLFRNADGNGIGFGDRSLPASSTDWGRLSVFAAKVQRDGKLTLVAINKDSERDVTATIALSNFRPARQASVYRLSAVNPSSILKEPELAVPGPIFTATFPRYSATLLVLYPVSSP